MKSIAILIVLLTFGTHCSSQNFHLKIIGTTSYENKVIDSLKYNSVLSNAKTVNDEVVLFSQRLLKLGYLEQRILENTTKKDSVFIAKFSLGKKTECLHLYIGEKNLSKTFSTGFRDKDATDNPFLNKDWIGSSIKNDTIVIAYSQIESFLNNTLQKLEQKGFAFAKLKIITIQKKNSILYAALHVETGQERKLNSIVVNFDANNKKSSFPEGHLHQLNRKYKNTTLNQEMVRKIQSDFNQFPFVTPLKSPEILFTTDTTKVYVYLEKRKANTFDGFIGFANSNSKKLTFNGYLDLVLENTIQAGEQFALYWKSDGNNQKTFKAGIDLPYIFKSPLGLKAQIQIFKQDSIFQNTKTAIDLGYLINYNTRIYLGYQSTASSDIQNTNSSTISDYTNSFITTNLEYAQMDYKSALFQKKSFVSVTMGIGKRATADLLQTAGASKQAFININARHNFCLNSKNYFNINYQNYFLKSERYIVNELYRFGGTTSIRGFAENSLQGNFMSALITEYRYVVTPEFYLHSVLDYAYYQDKSSNTSGNLAGLGLGLGLLTKNGVISIQYANGSTNKQILKGTNSIVHVIFKTSF